MNLRLKWCISCQTGSMLKSVLDKQNKNFSDVSLAFNSVKENLSDELIVSNFILDLL